MMARLAFVIAFEHFVFVTAYIIMWFIPDVPRDIRIKLRREEYRVSVRYWVKRGKAVLRLLHKEQVAILAVFF